MKIVTAEQMRALDRAATEKHGIASLDLMERAGRALCDRALELAGGDSFLVVAGAGNNGGDGLVAARLLAGAGAKVHVIILSRPEGLSPDAGANLERLERTGVRADVAADERGFDAAAAKSRQPGVIVDAVFGTGLAREVEGVARRAIEFMNGHGAHVVSADIPSGLSADTGEAMGAAVRAGTTVTFGLPKRGLVLGRGPEHAGRIVVADIGIPAAEAEAIDSDLEMTEPSDFIGNLSERTAESHKGSFGHVAVFAGSGGHLGAGYLASIAALRAGAGLVTYCMPEAAFERFDARYPEIMCDAIPDGGRGSFGGESVAKALEIAAGRGAIAIGPAVGTSEETRRFVNEFLARAEAPAVIDADGLNCLDVPGLAARRAPAILTPHPGEMGRLSGAPTAEVQADRVGFARRLAKSSGATVVLKGHLTVVAVPEGRASINPTGNPGMASAGMGDALTGMIAAFVARGIDPAAACRAAAYVHGLAGDIAARELGEESVIATDVIEHIGRAIEKCRGRA